MAEMASYAKINLTLDVLGKREDGYHDLKMVMQSVSLCDEIRVNWKEPNQGSLEGGKKPYTTVESNLSYLPTGEKNLAVKATGVFYKYLGEKVGKQPNELRPDMEIYMKKQIPVCAGLAGGSGNGAVMLKLLNNYHKNPFTLQQLCEMGEEVGSDVPYCVLGGTALAEGKGERLTPLPVLPFCYIVLCKPNFPISTPELFQKIDSIRIKHRPHTDDMIKALEEGDLTGIACRLFNVFEEALHPRQQKIINEIKGSMGDEGAIGTTMSGSGPTVVGFFTQEERAKQAVQTLQAHYHETYLTTPL